MMGVVVDVVVDSPHVEEIRYMVGSRNHSYLFSLCFLLL